MKLRGYLSRVIASIAIFLACTRPAPAQSFTLLTTVIPAGGGGYVYDFSVAYDRLGDSPVLTAPIWQWTFYLEPFTPSPDVLAEPDGWTYTYKPDTGEFCWYTQGANGWVMGDFGDKAIAQGQALGGFRIKTPLPPGANLANGFDTQYHQDVAVATVPAAAFGDVNFNGVLDLDDVVQTLRIAAGLQASDQLTYGRGDVTTDGEVTLLDGVYTLRRLGSL